VWTYTLGPILAFLPKPWRKEHLARLPVKWGPAGFFSGVLELLGFFPLLILWYSYFVTAFQQALAQNPAAGGIPEGRSGLVGIAGFVMNPITWVVCYVGIEGLARILGSMGGGEVGGTLFLAGPYFAWRKLSERTAKPELPLVRDEVTPGKDRDEIQIAACRVKAGWKYPFTIRFGGGYFQVMGVRDIKVGPRPVLYTLRRLPPGEVARGLADYDPSDALIVQERIQPIEQQSFREIEAAPQPAAASVRATASAVTPHSLITPTTAPATFGAVANLAAPTAASATSFGGPSASAAQPATGSSVASSIGAGFRNALETGDSLNFGTRFIIGPFVSLLPLRWRNAIFHQAVSLLAPGAVISGAITFALALVVLAAWFNGDLGVRWTHAQAMLFATVFAYIAIEGLIRAYLGLTTGEVHGIFVLGMAEGIVSLVTRPAARPKTPLVEDEITPGGATCDLKILSCREKRDWKYPYTIRYGGAFFQVTGSMYLPRAPRPYVYSLRRLQAGEIAGGLKDYTTKDVLHADEVDRVKWS
jgi:hypothetical protein